ncbi:hypothetical protein CspHIS471_0102810 [Cutaneotrichosporon sp. HIS471]|nr:hypothetical protein CspHIS471_0102810 [Cutaneotrichosporon sp. HIS471]
MSVLARSVLGAPRLARTRLPTRVITHSPFLPPAIARYSTRSGPKWNSSRVIIAAAVSLVAFGSAGWAWHLVENREHQGEGPELSDESTSPATQHDNAKFPTILHPALDAYKAAYKAEDYTGAEAVLRGLYAAAAEMPPESFTGSLAGAVGKRRVAQELAALLAEVMILQDRPVDAWILMRDEYDALGDTPFTSWPEGPVRTVDAFDAVLYLARKLARGAHIQSEREEPSPFPSQEKGPAAWAQAVMYYNYAQAAAMLDLGLAHLAPEEKTVHNAFRPAEEGEPLAVLDTTEDPGYQEEARQHTATKFRLLGDALYRDGQRLLASQYLQLAFNLCDPASPLANHQTLLGAALAQEQLAEVAFVSEYLHNQGKPRFTKAIRHLHRCLALLERSEELSEQLAQQRGRKHDDASHAALVNPTRMQTFFHLAMYEAAAGNMDSALGALADLNHLADKAGTPIVTEPPAPVDGRGRDLAEVAAELAPSWWSVSGWFKEKELEASEAAGLVSPPRWK